MKVTINLVLGEALLQLQKINTLDQFKEVKERIEAHAKKSGFTASVLRRTKWNVFKKEDRYFLEITGASNHDINPPVNITYRYERLVCEIGRHTPPVGNWSITPEDYQEWEWSALSPFQLEGYYTN